MPGPRPPVTTGRILLTVCAILTATASFLADWSETHVLNPNWPPHAKFHNGQTMSFALLLGILTIYYTWRSATPTSSSSSSILQREVSEKKKKKEKQEDKKDDLWTAAIFASVYYVAALSAILYPGSLAVDPEFGEGFPQLVPFVVFGTLPWVGYWVG